MFHVHRWTRWEDVPVLWSSPLFRIGPRVVEGQQRECEKCGEKQLRTIN